MSSSLKDLTRCSVAVDLGAARTRVHVKGTGLIVDQPSVVAVNTRSGALIAAGGAAARMDGRTPRHIRVVRPVCGGTVVDIDMAQRMLRALVGDQLRGVFRRRAFLRAVATIPHDADPLAHSAAVETLTGVGAKSVELVDAPTAAGIGCGLPVQRPEATMILVCGAATTQVAVLSLGSIVAAGTVHLGGDTIHNAVVQYVRNRHELLLPSQAVRPLHLALTQGVQGPTEVLGRDVVTGLARTVTIDPDDVRSAVQTPMTGLTDTIRAVLHRCPPDLVADLAERGMVLAGGSAVLPGLDERLRECTGMRVRVADRPELSAVDGLAALMDGRVPAITAPPARGGRSGTVRLRRRRPAAQGAAGSGPETSGDAPDASEARNDRPTGGGTTPEPVGDGSSDGERAMPEARTPAPGTAGPAAPSPT